MIKNNLFMIIIPIITLLLMIPLVGCQANQKTDNSNKLNFEGIVLLVDLMKTLIENNPDYLNIQKTFKTVNRQKIKYLIDSLSDINAGDSVINHKINSLLSTDAYKLYYSHFRNVTPETHRKILLALPYARITSPAGISDCLLEICMNIDSVKSITDKLPTKISLDRCRDKTSKWLPAGEYHMPDIYFIMDGNGDAFATDSNICFDLFSLLFNKRPYDTRYKNIDSISFEQIEEVLAHELHHIYTNPYFDAAFENTPSDWKNRWRNHVIRRIVCEGIAQQCNSPVGLNRVLKEDTTVVRFWIEQLNNKLKELESGGITEDEAWDWLSKTYQEIAKQLLKDYLAMEYSGEELTKMVRRHSPDRPSFIYTLGWWMITRIEKSHEGHAKVIELISEPHKVFSVYNEVIGNAPDYLIVQD